MAPLLLVLALMLQDAPTSTATPEAAPSADAPMATAVPRKQVAAPLPIQGGAVTAPTDDYGYVAWCYGAIASYVDLYDRAMPEVIRIERAWPTPSTEENISEVYPAQRDESKRNLILFTRALQAAEKASPTPIHEQGLDGVRRGRAMWTGATSVPKAQLAQFWMSWSPPAKCEETAKALEARSLLFGQALGYNAKGVTVPAAPAAAEEPVTTTAFASAPPAEPTVDAAADVAPNAPPLAPESDPAMTVAQSSDAVSPGETPMVEVRQLPSEDSDKVAASSDVTATRLEPVVDAAALSAGTPEPTMAAEAAAEPSPTAIDDLLPTAEPAAAAPAVVAPPAAEPPAEKPAQPAPRKQKRGLKDTLKGMRGKQ